MFKHDKCFTAYGISKLSTKWEIVCTNILITSWCVFMKLNEILIHWLFMVATIFRMFITKYLICSALKTNQLNCINQALVYLACNHLYHFTFHVFWAPIEKLFWWLLVKISHTCIKMHSSPYYITLNFIIYHPCLIL